MALDTRRCFWFGTEERASFYATPLKGADSSPSAWGADGTLLNGGGYGFNSFGSHKRYTYEWPQSSSPETAQMMKSYRDGTYGRGLLYFLEPGIYKTNVLPAAWADPSMAINHEAPSLVYNVDPLAVPTSGGADLGLPVVSALYDLSTTPAQTYPTPDTSVFLPVPTGHTLILGAFYSATGTGGIFATPVNNNGTLGANVKLTEKTNSDTDVVTDQFAGDIKGVRLWVGRSDATASTVTIAAMCGRLMETSDIPVYGPWSTIDTNLFPNPAPTTTTNFVATSSTLSISNGGLTITSTIASAAISAVRANFFANGVRPPVTPGATVAVSADMMSLQSRSGSLSMLFYDASNTYIPGSIVTSAAFTNTPVFQRRSLQTVVPVGAVSVAFYFSNGGTIGIGESVTFAHIRFGTPGSYFDGSTNPSGELERTRWLGTENASASVTENRTRTGNPNRVALLVAGPWIGGQGHSGCRFLGTPSYVNNGPVEGGRVGFAASFIEVGSWVYG